MTFDKHPISNIKWIKIDEVQANNYNPNAVAKNEMNLLTHQSKKMDTHNQ